MTKLTADFLETLKGIVGPGGYRDSPEDIAPHLIEPRGLWHGETALVVRPDSTEQVASVVSACAAAAVPIVPQGGNTGLCGGASATGGGAIILELGRLNRIRSIDPANYAMVAEAGCILSNLQSAADAQDLLFPLSLAAEGSCQIGGNVSTNAGGIHVLRYGNTRDLVLGLEAVLPDGRIWRGLRALRKDNTGYDIKQLLIGAEGTLGIITAVALRLYPKPRDVATGFAALSSLDGLLEFYRLAREASGDRLTAIELVPQIAVEFATKHMSDVSAPLADPHDWSVLVEFSSPEADAGLSARLEAMLGDAYERGLVVDATIADSEAKRLGLWRLRESISEAQKFEGGSIKHDISVPVSSVPAFIESASRIVTERLPTIRPVPFGHVGDGNVHFNLSQPVGADKGEFLARWAEFNHLVHQEVARYGGSMSAEHGIGLLKRDEMAEYEDPVELDLMARIKRAFDPQNIMNPGKVLPRDFI